MDNDKLLKQIKLAIDSWADTQLNIKSEAAREILARHIVKKINDSQ